MDKLQDCFARTDDLTSLDDYPVDFEPYDVAVDYAPVPDNIIKVRRRLGRGSLYSRICREEAKDADSRCLAEIDMEPAERVSCIAQIVNKYATHSYVEDLVARHNLPVYPGANLSNEESALPYLLTRMPVLSAGEERSLFATIDNGVNLFAYGVDLENPSYDDEKTMLELVVARQILFMSNLKYVNRVVNQFSRNPNLPKEDVLHEGMTGLTTAIDRFDVTKGYRFLTYADAWIRRNIRFAYSDQSRVIRVSRDRHNAYIQAGKASDSLRQELQREPTIGELAFSLGIDEEDLRYSINASSGVVSLDAPIKNDDSGEITIADVIADDKQTDPISALADSQYVDQLVNTASLTDKAKLILSLFHPEIPALGANPVYSRQDGVSVDCSELLQRIKSGEKVEQREIADIMGLNSRYIRQVRDDSLQKLRDAAAIFSI